MKIVRRVQRAIDPIKPNGNQIAAGRGINSSQAIKEEGGWRVTSIMLPAESATAPLPKEYLP